MDIVFAVAIGLVLAIGIPMAIWRIRKCSNTWTVIAEGQFGKARFERRTGPKGGVPAFPGGAWILSPVAIIRFFDGTDCEAYGVDRIQAQRGDRIRVLENGLGDCKVEKVEEA